jgi:glycine/D-amino acid oxidase-like deaminating enzyme
VRPDAGRIDAEAAVVALGPWSPDLLGKFGYRFPMVRKRGYHRHFSGGGRLDLPVQDPSFAAPSTAGSGLRADVREVSVERASAFSVCSQGTLSLSPSSAVVGAMRKIVAHVAPARPPP